MLGAAEGARLQVGVRTALARRQGEGPGAPRGEAVRLVGSRLQRPDSVHAGEQAQELRLLRLAEQ